MSDNVAVHHPDVEFIRPCNLCPHMKRITLANIRAALEENRHEVTVDPAIAVAARRAVERMLANMTDGSSQYDGHIAIVGSGLAGLMTALTLAPQPVVIVTRATLGAETSSAWAQGGIAAALGSDDSADMRTWPIRLQPVTDCASPQTAQAIVSEAPAAIAAPERADVRFDLDGEGRLSRLVWRQLIRAAASSTRPVTDQNCLPSCARLQARSPARPRSRCWKAPRPGALLTRGSLITGLLVSTSSGTAVVATSSVVLATRWHRRAL